MRIAQLANPTNLVRVVTWCVWLGIVACILVVAFVGVNSVWSMVAGPPRDGNAVNMSTAETMQSRTINIESIVEANLFGKPHSEDLLTDIENLRETTLNLSLEGTFVAIDSDAATMALISNRDGSGVPKPYRSGDAIAGFAAIESIQPKFVVISRSGERERLTFPEANILQLANKSESVEEGTPLATSQPKQSQPQALNADIEWGMTDLKQLGLAEVKNHGTLALEVTESDGTSILGRLGMLPGDVVLSVNGVDLQQLRNNQALANEILASGFAKLEIIRDDRDFVVTVPLP